ncbi:MULTISPECIES: hypothetical protein [Ramlibacter]|uniref:Uncharacterized protein n=1 Tax=Ramlibacter pinisoli TaxID=2682844 RepID=A0A6N8ITF1_9BURK|nr:MULTISPECIES: hypothetical protein [Ramlibacter]MBA2965142.1 hypothetical protein [Ramlibacter sp. CGMCC 1.13660]MVQ30107.1 hypothetical protein [Ramlibacter pinisoli]
MDKQFQRWHDAERVVRELEKKSMIAQVRESAGSTSIAFSALRQQLLEARVAANRAFDECLNLVTRQRAGGCTTGPSCSGGGSNSARTPKDLLTREVRWHAVDQ